MSSDPIGDFLNSLYSDGVRFSGGTVSIPKVLKAVKSRSFEDDLKVAVEAEVQIRMARELEHWKRYSLPDLLRKERVNIINQLQTDGDLTITALAVYASG